MAQATCSVDGCDREARTRGWCRKHYKHWWKYGTPHNRPTFEVCRVEGCDGKPRSRTSGLCDMHYCRRWRTGSLERQSNRLAQPGYRAAHSRVSRARGKAKEHACLDCGEQAKHWSFAWRGVDSGEWLWENFSGVSLAYTGSPDDYEPRCSRCARVYDADFAREGWRTRAEQTNA